MKILEAVHAAESRTEEWANVKQADRRNRTTSSLPSSTLLSLREQKNQQQSEVDATVGQLGNLQEWGGGLAAERRRSSTPIAND
jgi:hypothetical protein